MLAAGCCCVDGDRGSGGGGPQAELKLLKGDLVPLSLLSIGVLEFPSLSLSLLLARSCAADDCSGFARIAFGFYCQLVNY